MVHMASVWVPFTSESKEAIASYPEIQKELRLGLQAVGRKLGMYLRRRMKVKQEGERRQIFLRYLGEVATAVSEINDGRSRRQLYEQLLQRREEADGRRRHEARRPRQADRRAEDEDCGENVLIVDPMRCRHRSIVPIADDGRRGTRAEAEKLAGQAKAPQMHEGTHNRDMKYIVERFEWLKSSQARSGESKEAAAKLSPRDKKDARQHRRSGRRRRRRRRKAAGSACRYPVALAVERAVQPERSEFIEMGKQHEPPAAVQPVAGQGLHADAAGRQRVQAADRARQDDQLPRSVLPAQAHDRRHQGRRPSTTRANATRSSRMSKCSLNSAARGAAPVRPKARRHGRRRSRSSTAATRSIARAWAPAATAFRRSSSRRCIQFKKCNAKFILHVEKDTVWQRFNEDKFWQKHNCILTHGGGQPPRGVRRLLYRLHNELKLPIYCLLDNDPWGYYIYSVIKQGSINLAYESQRMAIPDARFLGLRSNDYEPLRAFRQREDQAQRQRHQAGQADRQLSLVRHKKAAGRKKSSRCSKTASSSKSNR